MRTTTTADQSKAISFSGGNRAFVEHGARISSGVRISRELRESNDAEHPFRHGAHMAVQGGVRISGTSGVRISGQRGVRISGQRGVRISATSARRPCAA